MRDNYPIDMKAMSGLAAALLLVDGLAWRVVASMFDRERLIAGSKT